MRKKAVSFFIVPLLTAGFLLGGAFLLWAAFLPVPDIASFEERRVVQSAKIYDRTGEVLLFDLSRDVRRSVVPLSEISPFIRNATIAIEDDTFYEHPGVRPLSFLRAIVVNLTRGGFAQGGSTITQQVVKNSVLTGDKSVTRKIKEWIIAMKIERTIGKDEILTIYLNESPYGGTLYGVEEASRSFFGKSASNVTLAEAAYLAALPQAPSFFSPYGNNTELLEARKNTVLRRMKELSFITEEGYEEALAEEVVFRPQGNASSQAPLHFVFHVQAELERLFGRHFLEEGGIRVITTLDAELQERAQEIVARHALSNTDRFGVSNASLVAIDPRTGEVLTMVGSRNYFDADIDGNFNAAFGLRQPGSSIKPFIYAQALREGYTRDTVLFDVRTQFSPSCGATNFSNTFPCYSPRNYDGLFRGPMRMIDALGQSINVPAVKALYLVGINDAIALASRMGVSTLTDPARYGLSLVLGGGAVRLFDMVSAYGVFATEGVRATPRTILEIRDKDDAVVYATRPQTRVVLEAPVAREMNVMLSNNDARTPMFGANSLLHFPGYDVAVKTGTSNDFVDAWVIGYTPYIVVGAWAGNNDNSPATSNVTGSIVTPLWNEFMRGILSTRERAFFSDIPPVPDDIKPVLRGVVGYNERNEFVGIRSILHFVDKQNPRGAEPVHPERDPQYSLWEAGIRLWVNQGSE